MNPAIALPVLLLTIASPRAPDAREVARRAIVVSAVHSLRLHPRAGEPTDLDIAAGFERDRRRVVSWLETEGLLETATDWERRALTTKVGRLSPADGRLVAAQGQTLAVLLWALGRTGALPAWDGSVDPRAPRLERVVPGPGDSTARFIAEADLRPAAALSRAHDVASLWSWRARTQEFIEEKRFLSGAALERGAAEIRAGLLRLGRTPPEITGGAELLDATVLYSALWAHRDGMIAAPIDGDLPARGGAYRKLAPAERRLTALIAELRLAALDWLLGSKGDSEG